MNVINKGSSVRDASYIILNQGYVRTCTLKPELTTLEQKKVGRK